MRIAFVASEAYPFSKTGGLADVASALPAALVRLGHEVTLFTPLHRSARKWVAGNSGAMTTETLPDSIWIGDVQFPVRFILATHEGCRVAFVVNDEFYDRDALYMDADGRDHFDNVPRFAFFCRAVLEYYLHLETTPPDIFHVNDWQTALLPLYLGSSYQRPELAACATTLTIHNLGYQGSFPAEHIYFTGLDWSWFNPHLLEYYGSLNLLKAGIVTADCLTTVSPTYAKEIQTPELGMGLDGVLRANASRLTGILNGIDERSWNPAIDSQLPANYWVEDITGKAICKGVLQAQLGLPTEPDALLLGVVSRFDRQKGIDLILDNVPKFAALGVQIALLGSGMAELEDRASILAADHPMCVGLQVGFDEALSHLIHAGGDVLLMPSLYEPCGLNQLYAQRYGTIPVVRETGGLKDTVINVTAARLARNTATGFTFRRADAAALLDSVRRAHSLYCDSPAQWRGLMRTVMSLDRSWDARAAEYLNVYGKAVSARRSGSQLAGPGTEGEVAGA